jgi:adenosylhomocysteine nucleosidase
LSTIEVSTIEVIVIAAMEEEIAPFLQRATDVGDPVRVGNAIHRNVAINGVQTLLVQGGIGLVNAAGAATSALLLANPDAPEALRPLVISAGTAGGLGDSVRVGDVVVGTDNINANADARAFGYVLGQVPGMPVSYPVPQLLLDLSSVVVPEHRTGETLHQGLLLSSDSFVDQERSIVVKELFDQVLATDMESSAIAQTCHVYGAPFLSIRGISDLCGPASDADFLVHVDDAAERSAEIVTAVIGSWAAAGSPRTVAA